MSDEAPTVVWEGIQICADCVERGHTEHATPEFIATCLREGLIQLQDWVINGSRRGA